MTPTVGSPLSLIAASGVVRFEAGTESWEEPLIGYAVVVKWTRDSDDLADDTGSLEDYETRIEPVVLDEGMPTVVSGYLDSRSGSGYVKWTVVPG